MLGSPEADSEVRILMQVTYEGSAPRGNRSEKEREPDNDQPDPAGELWSVTPRSFFHSL